MTIREVAAEMVKAARDAGETRPHHAFELFRFDFGVEFAATKPTIRPPEAETSETPDTE